MRDDGHRSNHAELYALQERRGDEHAVEKVVHRVAHDNERPASAAIVLLIVDLAILRVAVPPEQQLLQDEEAENSGEDGECHLVRLSRLEGVRDDLEKCRAQERADRKDTSIGTQLARTASDAAARPALSVPPPRATRIQPSVMGASILRQPYERTHAARRAVAPIGEKRSDSLNVQKPPPATDCKPESLARATAYRSSSQCPGRVGRNADSWPGKTARTSSPTS